MALPGCVIVRTLSSFFHEMVAFIFALESSALADMFSECLAPTIRLVDAVTDRGARAISAVTSRSSGDDHINTSECYDYQ